MKKNKLWKFLNSGLGIWFLSSIFLTSVTFIYNSIAQRTKDKRDRTEKIEKLDLEIESRISQFWTHLKGLSKKIDDTSYAFNEMATYDTIAKLWDAFKNSPIYNPKLNYFIYNDFNNRPITSLIFELATLLKSDNSPNEEKHIKNVGLYLTTADLPRDVAIKNVNYLWKLFTDNIIRGRWTSQFPYTYCVTPFCE